MTLIASILGGPGLYQVSDILVTRDSPQTHQISNGPLVFSGARSSNGFIQSGYLRKTIIADKYVTASFSGNVMQGIAGLKIIEEKSNQMQAKWSLQDGLDAIRSEFHNIQSLDVSFLFSMMRLNDGVVEFKNNSVKCQRDVIDDLVIRHSGSGSHYFLDPNITASFESIRFTKNNGADILSYFVLPRVANMFLNANIDDSFDFFRFGGWYDIISFNKDGFCYIDYGVAFISHLKPFTLRAYARSFEIDGFIYIFEMVIDDPAFKSFNARIFSVRNPLSNNTKMKMTDIDLINYIINEKIGADPLGLMVVQQDKKGKFLCGYTSNMPFVFRVSDRVETVLNEENIERLIDNIRSVR